MGIFDVAFARDLAVAVFGFWSTVLSQYIFQYSLGISILTLLFENQILSLLQRVKRELVLLDLFPKREISIGVTRQFLLCAFILGAMLPTISVILSFLYVMILDVLLDIIPAFMNELYVYFTSLSFFHVGWLSKAICPPCFVVVFRKISWALFHSRLQTQV